MRRPCRQRPYALMASHSCRPKIRTLREWPDQAIAAHRYPGHTRSLRRTGEHLENDDDRPRIRGVERVAHMVQDCWSCTDETSTHCCCRHRGRPLSRPRRISCKCSDAHRPSGRGRSLGALRLSSTSDSPDLIRCRTRFPTQVPVRSYRELCFLRQPAPSYDGRSEHRLVLYVNREPSGCERRRQVRCK
jgi:hypothetical protein